jgi:hypothetical protein
MMTHYWRVRATLPDRFGQPCRVLARGRMNSICIEFADGVRHIVSRYAVRLLNTGK